MASVNSAELQVNLTFDNSKAAAALQASLSGLTRQTQNFNRNPIIAKNFTQPLGRITGAANEFTKSLEASNARVLAFGASAGAIFAVQKAMSELVKTTISVEQKLTDINALLNVSDKQFKRFSDGLFQVARQTGMAFNEVADSANEFARQGLSVEDTLKRTNSALALSKLGMMDSVNATESLTAALNTFKGEVSDSEVVVNKLAQVDAKFAVSSKDLAEAIKRTGASASDASVSFNELLAAVTVTQERTARGGAVIGNAFKTIFTRIQRPEVLDQLEAVGVTVRKQNGEILPAIDILKQYGAVYDGLTPALKSNTAQLVAGGRQINILKSLLPELASSTGKFDEALRVANETTTEATDRLKLLTATTQGTLNAVVANLTKTASEIGTLSIKPAIDNILKGLDTITDLVGPSNFFGLGETVGKGVYEGIGKVISGPGLILLGTVLAKLGGNLLKFVSTSGAQFLGLNKAADEQARTQTIISNLLAQRPDVMQKILTGQVSVNDAARVFGNELKMAEVHYKNLNNLASQLAARQKTFSGPSGKRTRAEGLIPNFVPNFAMADAQAEREAASAGGYRAGQVRRMNMPGMGPVTYNGKEKVKQFPGMEQPAIMPPALSKAGKDYRNQFKSVIGFDPYNEGAAFGFVPNFNLGKIGDPVLQGAINSGYFTADEKKIIGNQNMDDLRKTYKAENVRKNSNLAPFRNKLLGLGGTAEAGREAAKLTAQMKKEATEGGEIDIGKRIGLLSMFGKDQANATTSTTLGQLSAFSEVIDAARATDPTGKNAKILSNAQITFKNVQVRSLEQASKDMGSEKNEVYEKFRASLNKNLTPVLSQIGAESIAPILGNQSPKVAEIQKKLKSSGSSLLPPGAEGDIFEQVIRLATKSPTAFVKSLGDDFRAPFDFEEDGQAGYQFRKQFFGKKGFDMKALVKADAKRTSDPKSIRSLIKKAYNQAILAEKSDERKLIRDFNLPYAGSTVSATDPKSGKTTGPFKQTKMVKAGGHVPNFSLKGISDAIAREDRSGVRRDKIRVGYDRRLAASGGLGVYNTDEGSLGNAINMHMAAGRNKSQIQRQGKAEGFIPNFAKRRRKGGSLGGTDTGVLMGDSGGVPQKFTNALEASADKIEEETLERDKSIAGVTAMVLIGGQMSAFSETVRQSATATELLGEKATEVAADIMQYGGNIAMFVPAVETGLDILTGSTRSLAGHFTAAGAAISEFAKKAGIEFGATATGSAASTAVGSGVGAAIATGVGGNLALGGSSAMRVGRAALGRGREAFAAGGKGILGRLAGLQKGLTAAGKVFGRFGGILGKVVGVVARILGPIGALFTIYQVGKKIYETVNKDEIARGEAAEQASESLKKSIDRNNKINENQIGTIDRLTAITNEYTKALKDEDKAKQASLQGEMVRQALNFRGTRDEQQRILKAAQTGNVEDLALVKAEIEQNKRVLDAQNNLITALDKLRLSEGKAGQETQEASALFRQSINDIIPTLDPATLSKIAGSSIKITDLNERALGFGRLANVIPGIDVDQDRTQEIVGQLQSPLSNLGLTGAEGQFLENILGGLENVDTQEISTELQIYGQLLRDAAKRTISLNKATTTNNTTLQNRIDRELKVKESLINLNKTLGDLVKQSTEASKINEVIRKGEEKRAKIIIDSNAKMLGEITSEYSKIGIKLRDSLTQLRRKINEDAIRDGEIAQQKQLELITDFGKGLDSLGPLTDLSEEFQNLAASLKNAALTGADAKQLEDIIREARTGAGFQADFGGPNQRELEKATPLFEKLLESVQDEGRRRAIENNKILAINEQSLKELRTIRDTEIQQLRASQAIKFGGNAAQDPEGFLQRIAKSQLDITTGRLTGNRGTETKGLVDVIKGLKEFQLLGMQGGTLGDISTEITNQLQTQIAGNLKQVLSELRIPESAYDTISFKDLPGLKGLEAIAARQAKNITGPDIEEKQLKQLEDLNQQITKVTQGNVLQVNETNTELTNAVKNAVAAKNAAGPKGTSAQIESRERLRQAQKAIRGPQKEQAALLGPKAAARAQADATAGNILSDANRKVLQDAIKELTRVAKELDDQMAPLFDKRVVIEGKLGQANRRGDKKQEKRLRQQLREVDKQIGVLQAQKARAGMNNEIFIRQGRQVPRTGVGGATAKQEELLRLDREARQFAAKAEELEAQFNKLTEAIKPLATALDQAQANLKSVNRDTVVGNLKFGGAKLKEAFDKVSTVVKDGAKGFIDTAKQAINERLAQLEIEKAQKALLSPVERGSVVDQIFNSVFGKNITRPQPNPRLAKPGETEDVETVRTEEELKAAFALQKIKETTESLNKAYQNSIQDYQANADALNDTRTAIRNLNNRFMETDMTVEKFQQGLNFLTNLFKFFTVRDPINNPEGTFNSAQKFLQDQLNNPASGDLLANPLFEEGTRGALTDMSSSRITQLGMFSNNIEVSQSMERISEIFSSAKDVVTTLEEAGNVAGAREAATELASFWKKLASDGVITAEELRDFGAKSDEILFDKEVITQADAAAAANKRLAESYGDAEEHAERLNEAIGTRFIYNAATFRKQSGDMILGAVDDFKGGIKGAFGEAIRGTATLREAFSSMFDNILDKMLDRSLDMGVDAIFGAVGAGFGIGKAKGGLIKGYNAGGFVNQGSGVRDDVPAMMQGGEYVIRKSSVNKYGRGLFDSLNSGGRVGYAMGDRIMQNRLRPEFVYNDPKRPTSGSFINTGGLSAFAMTESGSPMIGIQQERQKALENYIKDKKAYDEMVRKAQEQFKKQQKARMKSMLINVGLQAVSFGIGQMMGPTMGADAGITDLPTLPAGQQYAAKGGLIKAFARGGRNRDNIPAMLMGGEYVVNKRSVDKYGVGLFNDLNSGRARGFANGGMVGGDGGGVGGAPTTANNNFEINITMNGDGEGETTTTSNQNENQSQEQQERNEQLGLAVKNAVQTELIEQQRPGGLLYREDRI